MDVAYDLTNHRHCDVSSGNFVACTSLQFYIQDVCPTVVRLALLRTAVTYTDSAKTAIPRFVPLF